MPNWIRSSDGLIRGGAKVIKSVGTYLSNQQKAKKDTLYGKRLPLNMKTVKDGISEIKTVVKKRLSE